MILQVRIDKLKTLDPNERKPKSVLSEPPQVFFVFAKTKGRDHWWNDPVTSSLL